MEELIRQIYAQARLLKACPLFTGQERTLDDIVGLFLSTQGMEFCIKNRFPSIETLRRFKRYDVRRYGIYIDEGSVRLKNPHRAVLVGRTTAVCDYNELKRHELFLLCGAKAVVNASQWAVVAVEQQQGCSLIRNTSDNALILL